MESKCQAEREGKIEDVEMKLQGTNHILRRPNKFNFARRSDVYYFSDNSSRGILKRVPVKNGSYKLTELETLLENPGSVKIQNEIWSDVPLNSNRISESDETSGVQNDDSYKLVHGQKKGAAISKSFDETPGSKLSQKLKNDSIPNDYKDYLKTKTDGKRALKDINKDQNESFYKPFRGLKQKRHEPNISNPIDSEQTKLCISDKRDEKFSAGNIGSSSSKKTIECKDNDSLSETWTEKSLDDALNMVSMKMPVTEL